MAREKFWFLFLLSFFCVIIRVKCEYGVLHAEGDHDSGDFCVVYNPQWGNVPSSLEHTSKLPLVDAHSTLCHGNVTRNFSGSAVAVSRGGCTLYRKGVETQRAGGQATIIISNGSLFFPQGNLSAGNYDNLSIPMAVIAKYDWAELQKFGSVKSMKVQLYSPKPALVDGNLFIIWAVAVATVVIGAYWSGVANLQNVVRHLRDSAANQENEGQNNNGENDNSIQMTPVMVLIFVVLICVMLLLLFYFYDYLVYVVIVLFALASCNGLFECLRPIVLRLPLGSCKVPPNPIPVLKSEPQIRIIVLILFCMGMSVWWGIERNSWYAWILQDILGVAFCISLLKNIRLPNLKVCTILLVLLLIYDIFFVFITPLFSANGESVMVKVATGDGSKEQLPMVLKVPRLTKSTLSVCERPYSLLGFGDILVPGLFIGFCHSFDIMARTPRKIYFVATAIAYAVGLIITFVALYLMQQGQPALLYLVPCTLTTAVIIGACRGDLKKLWTGKMTVDNAESLNTHDSDSEEEILNRTRQQHSPSDESDRLLSR